MHFDDEGHSGSDSDADDGFNEDMEALRRACLLTGTNPNDLSTTDGHGGVTTSTTATTAASSDDDDDNDDAEEDIELVRNLQRRFANLEEPLTLMPLCSLPPEDSCEDDFETLRAIQRRFAAYNDGGLKESGQNSLDTPEQVGVTNKIASEKEASNNLFVERNNDAEEGFPNCVDTDNSAPQNPGEHGDVVGTDLVEWHDSSAEDLPALPLKNSGLPKPALAFVDAIKNNRSCQKVIRSKLMQIEARMEEIKKLKERVKILKDFQVGCKKRTSRALSQKKDARVQLISAAKERPSSKLIDKKIPAMHYGPSENPHAAIYRDVLTRFPMSVIRERWSKKETENLAKGLKQQFQEMLLQQSVNMLNDEDELSRDASDFDQIIASIRDRDITPQNIRSFLPKINWEQLASMYVPGRTGAECQARWLNCEDPLINRNPWTNMEEKNLLHIIQQKGLSNWIDIAVSLGTNRTPFQCLARYQRSLNASIIRRDWTKEEDNKLRAAVEEFGEKNWQAVASVMEARTGTQCSNRWKKTLHPARKRTGRWTPEEDKRLKVAVKLFGPKSWWKIAKFVPGRMQAQCRERWANKLDPNLNLDKWTAEEDFMLEEAIKENGYSWSKVAACVPRRTDNQCRRRWMMLFPEEVPLLRAAKRMTKFALISNFVDRESERPALGPNDFLPLPAIDPSSEPENANPSAKKKKICRQRRKRAKKDASTCNDCSEEVSRSTNCTEGEDGRGVGTSCRDLVTQAGEGSRRQKRKSVANDDTHLSVGDGKAVKNKRRKLKSNMKKSEGTNTADCCLSSFPNSTNGTEGEDVQAVGTSCGDLVTQAGEASQQQKRKSLADADNHISVRDGMVRKSNRRKSKSNRNKNEGTDRAECCLSSLPISTNGTEGEDVQEVGTSCGDLVTQVGKASQQQKRKSVADADIHISVGDGMAVKNKRGKSKSNRKKTEGTDRAECCSSSLPISTNETEGEDGQEVGTSCGDLVTQAGEGFRWQKRKSMTEDDIHVSVGDGMAAKNKRKKPKSNWKSNEGNDTAECCLSSLRNEFAALSVSIQTPLPPSHLGERNASMDSRIASETDAVIQYSENDKFGEGPQIQSLPPKCVQPDIPESGNSRAIVPFDQCKYKKSGDGACSSKVLEAKENGMSLASFLPGSSDLKNLPSSSKLADSGLRDVQCPAGENCASAAGVSGGNRAERLRTRDRASDDGVSGCNRPKRLRTRDEASSHQMLKAESGDGTSHSLFGKKSKKTRVKPAESMDDRTVPLSCEELQKTGIEPVEIEDEMTLSHFCKILKERRNQPAGKD